MHTNIPTTLPNAAICSALSTQSSALISGMSVQHLSEIESSKRDPRLSSIERIADAMELAVMLVPEHLAPDVRRYRSVNTVR